MMAIRKLNNIDGMTLIRGSSMYKKYMNNITNNFISTGDDCSTELSD